MIEEAALVTRHLNIRIESLDEIAHAVFDDSGEEYLCGSAVLLDDVVDVVLIVALANEKSPFGCYVERCCIYFLAAELPKFTVAVLLFSLAVFLFCPCRTGRVHL